jgi:hypothetical protein
VPAAASAAVAPRRRHGRGRRHVLVAGAVDGDGAWSGLWDG